VPGIRRKRPSSVASSTSPVVVELGSRAVMYHPISIAVDPRRSKAPVCLREGRDGSSVEQRVDGHLHDLVALRLPVKVP